MEYSKQVPAAERTLNILEALADSPDGLSAGELLTHLSIPRSALFALLNTLKARKYIEQSDSRGRYTLGTAVLALSSGKEAGFAPLVSAFKVDIGLSLFAETVALSWLDRSHTVILTQRRGAGRVQSVFLPSEYRQAAAAADGHVLLAGQSPRQLRRRLPTWYEENSERMQQIRQAGFAQVLSEDVLEIAAPICADGVSPSAALLLSIPVNKMSQDKLPSLTKQLQQAAARLSYRMGAPVYQPYGWAFTEVVEPNRALTEQELSQFLAEPWGARLACVRQDGTPHVLPLWYEWDGRFIWVAASPGAQWKTYLRESKQVSVTIDEPWPPLRRAFIVGTVDFAADGEIKGGLAALRQRLAVRYLGQGADNQPQFQEHQGWQAIRIRPERITGQQGLGAGHEQTRP